MGRGRFEKKFRFCADEKGYTDDQFKMVLRPTGYTLVGVRDRNKNK